MKNHELFYKTALSQVDGIGPIKFKKLLETFGSAQEVFQLSAKQLKYLSGLSETNALAIAHFNEFNRVEEEFLFAEKNNIEILDSEHPNYPTRLKHCVDAPAILFFKGSADLNPPRVISIIGTRNFTEYGRRVCEDLVEALTPYNVLITSGLAFGIDSIAHKAAVKHNIPTVGVIAHGLDSIYPTAHKTLSNEMTHYGGLLSEYFSKTKAEKGNFPTRNRIVAGMSDATIIIESDIKGGSLITADIAFSYNREVLCFPGRIHDQKSSGCNFLIKSLKGQLVTDVEDIANCLGWTNIQKHKSVQKQLFIELSQEEQILIDLLEEKDSIHIDEIHLNSNLNSAQLATALLNLEMQNVVKILPGKLITLRN